MDTEGEEYDVDSVEEAAQFSHQADRTYINVEESYLQTVFTHGSF
jgi:hypothetical protein